LVIAKAGATVGLGNLLQTYDGTPRSVLATTTPPGLGVLLTYDGGATAPIVAGSYEVVGIITDPDYAGMTTNTMVIAKAAATVTLGNLAQTYDGTAKPASAASTPPGLSMLLTYNGSATAPIAAGSYEVVGTITDPNYTGSATKTLVIAKAAATVTLGNLVQTYDGTAKAASAASTPSGLSVLLTYDGGATAPIAAGSYQVVGTITDPNYSGSATNTLVIAKAGATVGLGNLLQTYDGTPRSVMATTTPPGLGVFLTYDGGATVPTAAGSYQVVGTVTDPNYAGSSTNTLVIAKAAATLTLGSLAQTYDGTAKAASAPTKPSAL
jgi:hypothetical protein